MEKPDFRKHAEYAFRFLIERFGFTSDYEANQDRTYPERSVERVQYRSRDVIVEVSYSGRGELDVTVDENPSSHPFQLSLFLRAFHSGVRESLSNGIAYSDDEVRRELHLLADALQRYGKPLLEHDHHVFDRMKTFKWWDR